MHGARTDRASSHPLRAAGRPRAPRAQAVCDVVLKDGSISRQHAALLHADGSTYLQDLGSASGSFVDGVLRATLYCAARVPPSHAAPCRTRLAIWTLIALKS